MIVWEEILVANGGAILMMWFLLNCRRKNRENTRGEARLYDAMALVNLLGALLETVSFWVDGKLFPGARILNYLTNSLCFLGTVSIGFLWSFYVDLLIYRNYKRTVRNAKFLLIPWLIEVFAILFNLFRPGFLFSVSAENIYHRGQWAIIGYVTLMLYFVYTTHLVYYSKRQGINLNFFPVLYFIGPCLAGVFIQLFFYGITTSWASVAVALCFVQMQSYAENLYTDELSGLYNRRYLNSLLAEQTRTNRRSLYGIMMDINDFKQINDSFGHGTGDQAICKMGDILFRSIPEGGIALRYAGDEFIVLLPGGDEATALATAREINRNLSRFNHSGETLFTLTVSMGWAGFDPQTGKEAFLAAMDEKMYEQKRKYHQGQNVR